MALRARQVTIYARGYQVFRIFAFGCVFPERKNGEVGYNDDTPSKSVPHPAEENLQAGNPPRLWRKGKT
jgi:hypothetical protein